jgi:polar amino acid transport system substrate-binding protein
MKLTKLLKRIALLLGVLLCNTVSYADIPPVIKFQSTITPPIWSPDLPNDGIGGEILALLSKAAGVQYQIEYLPVKRFQQSIAPYRVGDPDILVVQKPYVVLPIMLFRSAFFFYQPHHKIETFNSLQDLKGHTLGVLRGTVADKTYFTNRGIQVEESDSVESLLRKLKKGRIDTCILVRIAGSHTIKRLFPQEENKFNFIRIPKSERPVAIIIDQDTLEAKAIAERYQKVLHKVLLSRQYREILEHFYDKELNINEWFEVMNKYEHIYVPDSN